MTDVPMNEPLEAAIRRRRLRRASSSSAASYAPAEDHLITFHEPDSHHDPGVYHTVPARLSQVRKRACTLDQDFRRLKSSPSGGEDSSGYHDPWSFAAKNLYRALSTIGPHPEELVQQFLEDVNKGKHLSPRAIYQRIGVQPPKYEEFLPRSEGESLEEGRESPKSDEHFESAIPEEPTFHLPEESELPTSTPMREPVEPAVEATGVSRKTITKIAGLFLNEEDQSWDELVHVIDKYGIRSSVDSATQYLLSKFSDTAEEFLKAFFPYKEMSLYLLVCLIQIISFQALLHFVPVIVCYLTFALMVYWTLMMFHHRRVLKQLELFRQLLKAFLPVSDDDPAMMTLSFDENPKIEDPAPKVKGRFEVIGPDEEAITGSESEVVQERTPTERHLWHAVESQCYFTTGLLVFVLFFALCSNVLPNCFFLGALSLFLCGLCLVVLGDLSNPYILTILVLELISHVRMIFPHRTGFLKLLFKDAELTRFGFITVKFGLASGAWFSIPFVFLAYFMSSYYKKRRSLSQTLTSVTTHGVVFLWWQVAIMLLLNVDARLFDPKSVILTFAVLALFLFRSTVAIGLVGSLAFVEIRDSLNFFSLLKALFIIFVLFIPFFYRRLKALLERRSKRRLDLGSQSKLILLVVFYIFLVSISVAFLYNGTILTDRQPSNLSWARFDANCGSLKLKSTNKVAQRVECSRYKGLVVAWQGTVNSVDLVKIENRLENLIDYLPGRIAQWLRCFYGSQDRNGSSILSGISNACDISAYNVHYFEIVVNPRDEGLLSPSPTTSKSKPLTVQESSVILTAGQKFLPVVTKLRDGDLVTFVASFDKYLLKYPQALQLLRLECVRCKEMPEKTTIASDVSYSGLWTVIYQSFTFLFNFIFDPFAVMHF